jgi:hypothetical protein
MEVTTMKMNKRLLALLAVAGLSIATLPATAKPDNDHSNKDKEKAKVHVKSTTHPDNHGAVVSAAAHTKTAGVNHGKVVSEVARSKNHSTKTHSTKTKVKHVNKGRVRKLSVREARRIRDDAIRAAKQTYKQRREAILNDGNKHDKLTNSQRRQLRDAERARNAAIKAANEQYRVTLRTR